MLNALLVNTMAKNVSSLAKQRSLQGWCSFKSTLTDTGNLTKSRPGDKYSIFILLLVASQNSSEVDQTHGKGEVQEG